MKKAKGNYQYRKLRPEFRPANGPVPGEFIQQREASEIHHRQPARYPFARIDNLLGDFSEQTGAAFG